jgi:hypothetical protein
MKESDIMGVIEKKSKSKSKKEKINLKSRRIKNGG